MATQTSPRRPPISPKSRSSTATESRKETVSPLSSSRSGGRRRRRNPSPPPRAFSEGALIPSSSPITTTAPISRRTSPVGILKTSMRSHSAKRLSSEKKQIRKRDDTTEASLGESIESLSVASHISSRNNSPRQPAIRTSSSPVPSTPKLGAVGEEERIPRVYEITELHECIVAQDWSQLETALQKLNNDQFYKRKREQAHRRNQKRLALQLKQKQQQQQQENEQEDNESSFGSGPRSTGSVESGGGTSIMRLPLKNAMSVLKLLPQSMSIRSPTRLMEGRSLEKEIIIISPLLKLNGDGRNPLHLALLYKCPDKILLSLILKDRLAATQPDDFGQLPLHLAMVHHQHQHILDKLIQAHPAALKQKDSLRRTPIGYAVELARNVHSEKEEAVLPNYNNNNSSSKVNIENPDEPFYWGTPLNENEKAWQFDQIAVWSMVDYLLKDLMRRKKNLIPSERTVLVDALDGGAPPKVINRLISTTDKYLMRDDGEFAGRALERCADRQYPLDTLEYLVKNIQNTTTILTDYTQKALVAHYRLGCRSLEPGMVAFGKEIIDWCKLNRGRDGEQKDDARIEEFWLTGGATAQCREWWSILRFLLFLAAYGKEFSEKADEIKDRHLLHAALSVPSAQPSLVQLLLLVYPEARTELCPTFKAFPLHLACTRWRYDVLRNDMDSSMEKVLKSFLKTVKEQLTHRYRGRLPLHMALIVGQSWGFVKSFVSLDKKSVGMRDPHTKLFPFQLAAMEISSKNLSMFLRNQYSPSEWRRTPQSTRMLELARARDNQDCRQVGTIFELLRRHPDATVGKYLVRDSFKVTKLVKGAGLVSAHYLTFVYQCRANGWRLNPTNASALRDSILSGLIAKPLVLWWDRLRKLIWETTPSKAMPESDDFLLHAALYNSDIPPTIIELLLALFPLAATHRVPGTQLYPLHIAAGTAAYHPQVFEVPYSMNNMELTLNAYKLAVGLTVNGQLPIHICLSRGKTWKEIQSLVKMDKQTLMMEDQFTKLVPFQLMATFSITSSNNILRFAAMAEKQIRNIEMEDLSVVERAKTLRGIKRTFDLEVLSTVYLILRRAPDAMSKRIPFVSTTTSSSSGVLSAVSSVNNGELESSIVGAGGNMAMMDHYLRAQESPAVVPTKSLSNYLEIGIPHGVGSLFSSPRLDSYSPPPPTSNGRMGDRVMVGRGASTSQRSLMSRSVDGSLYDDYVKPVHDDDDDDAVSNMGATTSILTSSMPPQSSTSTTPGSSIKRSARRGTKDRNRLPSLPDLNIDT